MKPWTPGWCEATISATLMLTNFALPRHPIADGTGVFRAEIDACQ